MAKSTDTKRPPDATGTMIDAMANWQAASLGALNWFGAPTIERMSDMGAEWMTFVAERVREDVALQHSLLHAKTPADVQHVQMTFLQNALDQYSAETGKMIELSSRLFETSEDDSDDDLADNVDV
ncbi:phasin family protein [uncultured Tateyamaria sp.]|uniref:phasin family protein n=1 Tax=uncultured Tateyamaria sp. TaxID=455651 RepID=UPI00262D4545|nr:phasin family protein [uncultured Tateyamaria sp.]